MGIFTGVKDYLVRTVARSVLLKYFDGYKSEIMRVIQAINMIIAAFYLLAPALGSWTGYDFSPILDGLNDKWLLALNSASAFGLEFALQDAQIKEKKGIPDPKKP